MKAVCAALSLAALASLSGCTSHDFIVDDLHGKCDKVMDFDIDFQRFDETAQQLAHGTGCMIETDLKQTGDARVKSIDGEMSIREALHRSLYKTQLYISSESPDRIEVKK